MPAWLSDRAFTHVSPSIQFDLFNMVGDPERLRGNRQCRVHCGRRRKKRRIDDEEILDVVRAAVRTQQGRSSVCPETERSTLMRGVAVPVRVAHHLPEAEAPENAPGFPH